MIPVCEPVLDGKEAEYLLDALRSNWISSAGPYIADFEEKFAAWCGAKYGISCTSGTTAIHLAVLASGAGPGDEVIIPTFNLVAIANMVMLAGAKPVLVDSDPKTWCIDASLIEAKVTPKTKAIIAVHMYGHPCDMDAIQVIADRHGLKVIEDAAEAHGAEYKGRRTGALGDAACFSFYGNKILTTGEGGMVVTNDPVIADRARLLRNQGFSAQRFVHEAVGFNYRFSNLLAAIGLGQLERLDEKVGRKRALAGAYTQRLAGADLTLPYEAPWAKSVYWMYSILLGKSYGRRDDVMAELKRNGIETRAFFCPMDQQPVFRKPSIDPRWPDISGRYPVAAHLWDRGLYLPSGLDLSDPQIDEVVTKLLACRS